MKTPNGRSASRTGRLRSGAAIMLKQAACWRTLLGERRHRNRLLKRFHAELENAQDLQDNAIAAVKQHGPALETVRQLQDGLDGEIRVWRLAATYYRCRGDDFARYACASWADSLGRFDAEEYLVKVLAIEWPTASGDPATPSPTH